MRLAALGLVVALNVGAKVALPGAGTGGLVVGDPVRRQQQRGHSVDHGGLARSDVAGEQGVLAVELEASTPGGRRCPS